MHKKKTGKLQTGITFPKQYWLAVNGKPKIAKYRKAKFVYPFNSSTKVVKEEII